MIRTGWAASLTGVRAKRKLGTCSFVRLKNLIAQFRLYGFAILVTAERE